MAEHAAWRAWFAAQTTRDYRVKLLIGEGDPPWQLAAEYVLVIEPTKPPESLIAVLLGDRSAKTLGEFFFAANRTYQPRGRHNQFTLTITPHEYWCSILGRCGSFLRDQYGSLAPVCPVCGLACLPLSEQRIDLSQCLDTMHPDDALAVLKDQADIRKDFEAYREFVKPLLPSMNFSS